MPIAKSLLREQRHAQLLSCAQKLFAGKGYHATSVEDVILQAGVSRGTFYNYFDSKRALFGEVLDLLFSQVWDSVQPIRTEPGDDVNAQVAGNMYSLCETLNHNQDLPRILFSEAIGLDSEANEQLANFYRRTMQRLVAALEEGQQLGIVVEGDAVSMAVCLLGMLKEYWFQSMLGAPPGSLEVFLPEVYRVLQGGMLRQPSG
jgi:AcrR family transcriptional regulator